MDFGGRQLYTRGVLQKLDVALENMIKTPKNEGKSATEGFDSKKIALRAVYIAQPLNQTSK